MEQQADAAAGFDGAREQPDGVVASVEVLEVVHPQQRFGGERNEAPAQFLVGGDRRPVHPVEPVVPVVVRLGAVPRPVLLVGDPDFRQPAKRLVHGRARNAEQRRRRFEVVPEPEVHRIPERLQRGAPLPVEAGEIQHRAAGAAEPEVADGERGGPGFGPFGGRVGEGVLEPGDRPAQELPGPGSLALPGGRRSGFRAPPPPPRAETGDRIVVPELQTRLPEIAIQESRVHRLEVLFAVVDPFEERGAEGPVPRGALQGAQQAAAGQVTVVTLHRISPSGPSCGNRVLDCGEQ